MKDTIVQVFKTMKDQTLKSAASSLTINVPYATMVAFDEEKEILYYSDDALRFSTEQFIQVALILNPEEMTYPQYREKYKEYMLKIHGDAPLMKIDSPRSEYAPSNPFQRLIDAGVNFKIQ